MEFEGRSPVELAKRIVDLEAQCDLLEHEKLMLREQVIDVTCKEEKMKNKCMKAKRKYEAMKDKFDLEERKWKDDKGKVRDESRELVVQKRKLEIDLKAAVVDKGTGTDEAVVKLRATEAEVEHFKSLLQERDGRIANVLAKMKVLERQSEVLERQNARLEMDFKARMAEEAKKQKLGEQENSEQNQKIKVLEREKERIVAELFKLKKENTDEAKKSFNLNNALDAERKRLEEVEGKAFQLGNQIGLLESANKALVDKVSKLDREKSELIKYTLNEQNEWIKKIANEKKACEDSKKEAAVLSKRIETLEKEKREMVAKFSKANMENNVKIQSILKDKIAAEAEKRAFEEEIKNKVMELSKWIEALGEEKCEMEVEVSRANLRVLNERVAVEADKRAFEEENKKMVVELSSRIEALEEEKRVMEATVSQANMEKNAAVERISNEKMAAKATKNALEEESKKLVSFLTMEFEALGEEKREIESKYAQSITEKNAEIQRILKEKITIEAERKAFEDESIKIMVELRSRIESLEEEKVEMEAQVIQANTEKIAAFERILNEKKALEEESKKRFLELTNRVEALEAEKKEMEAKNSQANMEMNEEIEKISKGMIVAEAERRAFEESSKKKIRVLLKKIEALLEEKTKSEAKILEKDVEIEKIRKEFMVLKEKGEEMSLERDEVIQVLREENETLEAQKNKLKMRSNRLVVKIEEIEDLSHQRQGSNAAGILGTLTMAEAQEEFNTAGGLIEMLEPFEEIARESHVSKRPFSAKQEDRR